MPHLNIRMDNILPCFGITAYIGLGSWLALSLFLSFIARTISVSTLNVIHWTVCTWSSLFEKIEVENWSTTLLQCGWQYYFGSKRHITHLVGGHLTQWSGHLPDIPTKTRLLLDITGHSDKNKVVTVLLHYLLDK